MNPPMNPDGQAEAEAEAGPPRLNGADAIAAIPLAKRMFVAALSCIIATILSILLASILPWFEVAGLAKYYAQNEFLWLFLLPPLSAIPLMFSSVTLFGRICWLHCWTVTVVSVDVPSAVIFVSFGASLVYSGLGTVFWSAGAYMVLLAHITSITSGLLFMKLAAIVEMGPVTPNNEQPPSGPVTVSIGEVLIEHTIDEHPSPFFQAP